MAWFRKEKKPRLPRHEKHEIPPDAWEKCDNCGHTDLREKFVRNLNVCPSCGFHRRIRASEYAAILLDEGTAEETEIEIRSTDPLGFPDYPARLKKARLGQRAIERKYPLIIISASGGARMQEGVLSLMQMAKAAAILSQLSERRIPYVSILTNPTTGGVSASFSMLGDAILAEPGAVIGFAGPRVIKQTIGQELPEGFQTAEFLLEHGIVDSVVPRSDLKRCVGQLLRHMSGKPASAGWTTS
jgi:acetyl-CoA carboxylase carboxyl transferase subunit beta